ncbi:putative aquaporin NIP4-1 [Drosera capensis]
MFVISGVSTDNRAIGELAGIAVGMTILLTQASGASMNTARSIGPALIKHTYKGLWVYIIGPIIGTLAGGYNLISFTDKSPRELTKSSSFLKSISRNQASV